MTASSTTKRMKDSFKNSFRRAARVLGATTAARASKKKTAMVTRKVASMSGAKRSPTTWTEARARVTS